MNSVHYDILTEATPKDNNIFWSNFGFDVTVSQSYI